VLPMGLTNAPSSFSRLMEMAFRELDHRGVLIYLDDVLVYSKTKAEHLAIVKKCFAIFKKYNFQAFKMPLLYDEQQILGSHNQ